MRTTHLFSLSLVAMFAALSVGIYSARAIEAGTSAANTWTALIENETNPRNGAGLVWHPKLGRFILFSGEVDHAFKGERGYDIQSIDLKSADLKKFAWENDLPAEGKAWGGSTGAVKSPEFGTPYFAMKDKSGAVRPSPRQMMLHYQYALAPWDDCIYMMASGYLLKYDPAKRTWEQLSAKPDAKHGLPAAPAQTYKQTLNWAAMCADPINQEIVLFGGSGSGLTDSGSPGTWAYSPAKNQWRKIESKIEPSPRALAPMAFDAKSGKIVLFGGDLLDGIAGDTWTYDCKTRTWAEQKPTVNPAPRFAHTLLSLPKQPGKLLLVGGCTVTSSTAYQATLYQPLPFELWVYDVAANRWDLLKRFDKSAAVPKLFNSNSNLAAIDDAGHLLLIGNGKKRDESATHLCRIDASQMDAAGTTEFGVKPGMVTYRTGSYDPEWYSQGVPPADPAATAKLLETLPANQWKQIDAPKWPVNRQGGGWSTVAYDTDRQQFLHLGGGHSSYFGNDVAHFDTLAQRWSISYRPQFALHYNYDLSGPGPWAFNRGPWGNHNYHAYQYDPVRQRLVFVRGTFTHFYDPVTRAWKQDELIRDNPFVGSKYTSYVVSTPTGVVVWANEKDKYEQYGIYKLTKAGWQKLATTGEALPRSETDGSTITFDSKRNRLLLTTSKGEKGIDHNGQVWAVDLASGEVKKLNPAGREKIVSRRYARESVYLPKQDFVMLGYHLGWAEGKKNQVPFYDVAKNRWLIAELPGSEFFSVKGEGSSVDLGLIYDAKRDLVWAVMCRMGSSKDLNAICIDEKLTLTPLE